MDYYFNYSLSILYRSLHNELESNLLNHLDTKQIFVCARSGAYNGTVNYGFELVN